MDRTHARHLVPGPLKVTPQAIWGQHKQNPIRGTAKAQKISTHAERKSARRTKPLRGRAGGLILLYSLLSLSVSLSCSSRSLSLSTHVHTIMLPLCLLTHVSADLPSWAWIAWLLAGGNKPGRTCKTGAALANLNSSCSSPPARYAGADASIGSHEKHEFTELCTCGLLAPPFAIVCLLALLVCSLAAAPTATCFFLSIDSFAEGLFLHSLSPPQPSRSQLSSSSCNVSHALSHPALVQGLLSLAGSPSSNNRCILASSFAAK
jgi:hypothetical protein